MHAALQELQNGSLCYRQVFDVSQSGYRLWYVPLVGGLAILLIGLLTEIVGWRSGRVKAVARAMIWLAASIVVSLCLLVATFHEYTTLRDALRRGSYIRVEGTVEHFEPDVGDHGESFYVGNHYFDYAASYPTNAYNTTAPHGGFVREGMHVRIADVSGKIARLQIPCNETSH